MKKIFFILVITLIFSSFVNTQIPITIHIQILKAEDARRYDKTLEDLLRSSNAEVRKRAALAAGRIGRDEAIPTLSTLLTNDSSDDVRAMAAFALGEIESIKAADAILTTLETRQTHDSVRARTVEAAGKIAAANPKDEKSKELGAAILNAVDFENAKRSAPSTDIIRLGMTAILRAKPAGGEETVRKFLHYADPNIVADALNTLARLRAKNANSEARELLKTHADPIVRANAARVLGAAEDKDALDILLNSATTDKDLRVRVAAIRALGNLKDAKTSDKVLERGNNLLADYKRSKFANPFEKSEMLEIATAFGRLLPNSNNDNAVKWLRELRTVEKSSPELESAYALVAPTSYLEDLFDGGFYFNNFRIASARVQGIRNLSTNTNLKVKHSAMFALQFFAISATEVVKGQDYRQEMTKVLPETARTYFAFDESPGDIPYNLLKHQDVFVRAAAAERLADLPKSKESIDALKTAFAKSLVTDKHDNDAQLAILDALYRLDKREATPSIWVALNASDYLVRKKAQDLLRESQKDPSLANVAVEGALSPEKLQLRPFVSGSKLGQVLNTDADYRRAGQRKNGSVKAVLRSEKGTFTIEFYPEDAPLTVDNFVKLARRGYFNGLEVHRVVPNFVMQDGDPRGDGNGGPGWSIRCELNMIPYDRGAVGMALSGKDTGGSQWFVTHSPQPHLDGGYTVFGKVSELDMKVVDNIVRGDKILSVKIVEANLPQRTQRKK